MTVPHAGAGHCGSLHAGWRHWGRDRSRGLPGVAAVADAVAVAPAEQVLLLLLFGLVLLLLFVVMTGHGMHNQQQLLFSKACVCAASLS